MGGLLAFRVGNYDNTAEREQFRFLCEQLKVHYENLGDFCVFAGNYNIGCELDAIFIKKDAIITIEFKNYGGHIIATENGEWTCDGQNIKGGSRKTVLQQARVNHSIVKRELKVLGVSANNVKDIPTLIVFNQPIELENKLSATTKSWLHITDNEHFINKLDDITCPKTDLNPLGIVNLAELLNLNSFFLEEFSNATYEKCKPIEKTLTIFENIKFNESPASLAPPSSNLHNKVDGGTTMMTVVNTKESESLIAFAQNILKSLLKIEDCHVTILDGSSCHKSFLSMGIRIAKEYVVKVESSNIAQYCERISRFISNDVRAINKDSIFWQEGELLFDSDESNLEANYTQESTSDNFNNNQSITLHKCKTVLPHWLDRYIFNNLGALYAPEHERFEYNLSLSDDEIKVYLGTYFPRSYAESFCVFDDLLKLPTYCESIKSLKEIKVLDLGCGTGGELIGLLTALFKYIDKNVSISVTAYDGNTKALSTLNNIFEVYKSYNHFDLKLSLYNKTITSEEDLNFIDDLGNFNFILNSKMVGELVSRRIIKSRAYYIVVQKLIPHLMDNGILYILDLTTKDEHSGYFLPQIMNRELNKIIFDSTNIVTLLPLACALNEDCQNACFIQQTFTVSHSRKSGDASRVCYRLICHDKLRNQLLSNFAASVDYRHIIHPVKYKQNAPSSICPKSKDGNKTIDTYNLKIE